MSQVRLSLRNPRSPLASTLGAQPLLSNCFLCRPHHRLLNSFTLLETLIFVGWETLRPWVTRSTRLYSFERRGGRGKERGGRRSQGVCVWAWPGFPVSHSLWVAVRTPSVNARRRVVLEVTVAEWLRRWTRNPMGFPRTGSNPVRDDRFFFSFKRV